MAEPGAQDTIGTTASAGGDPTIAIAFGGGGARGLSHIHVIEVLDELGIKPVAIAGSSIGAIMGAAMASGMSGRDIHDYAHAMLASRSQVASRMWRARPSTFKEMTEAGLRLTQFSIERILGSFLPDAIPDRFEDLQIPLAVTATDYFGHELVVFDSGDIRCALSASAAIPAVFRPVRCGGKVLIDGGICNPVPFDLLQGKADLVIAIDVVGAPVQSHRETPSSIELMFGATQLMMQSIIDMKLRTNRPDILIRPPVSRFRALDFLKIEAVLAETISIREELKRALDLHLNRLAKAGEGNATEE